MNSERSEAFRAWLDKQFDNVTLDEKDKMWHKQWYE